MKNYMLVALTLGGLGLALGVPLAEIEVHLDSHRRRLGHQLRLRR